MIAARSALEKIAKGRAAGMTWPSAPAAAQDTDDAPPAKAYRAARQHPPKRDWGVWGGVSKGLLEFQRCSRTGKPTFDTEARAEAVLAERTARDCGEQRSYLCEFCSGWHLTSRPYRAPEAEDD